MFLIHLYKTKNKRINILLIILFFITVGYLCVFYYYKFTEYGILKRIERFTKPLKRIIPVLQQKRKYISQCKDVLDYKLTDFFVFSSHNTYVAGNQNMDVNSLEMIKMACLLGVREIELDTYCRNYVKEDNESIEPIVTHGVESPQGQDDLFLNSNLLSFESCVKTISDNAFINNNDDPLFINIELNTHNKHKTNLRMIEILKQYFGDKLLYSKDNSDLGSYKIKDLVNKVIIVIHDLDETSVFQGISFDYYKNVSDNNTNVIDLEKTKNSLARVFPSANLESHFSYNYDPYSAWNKGAQFVTCNIQILDDNLKKQFKKFKKYSFVLKPKVLRDNTNE